MSVVDDPTPVADTGTTGSAVGGSRRPSRGRAVFAVVATALFVGVGAVVVRSIGDSPATDATPLPAETTPAAAPATPDVSGAGVPGVPVGPLRFETMPIFGGGEQGSLAVAPDGDRLVVAADVSGVHVSTDGGDSFVAANTGRNGWGELNVSSVIFDPRDPNVAWSASGVFGVSGGVHRSSDGGLTWERISTQPTFSGINSRDPGVPRGHPRSTGRLLAISPTTGAIFAATYVDGLMRSTDDGATWEVLGLAGEHLRGLAIDDLDDDTLYVASYESGLWRVDGASGPARLVAVANSPVPAEEVDVENGVVFLAAGPAGVWRSDDRGVSVRRLGVGILPASPTGWAAIDAATVGDGLRVVVGCVDPPQAGGGSFPCLFRSDDGGVSWVDISSYETVDVVVSGTDRDWWIDQAQRSFMFGKRAFFVSQIVINPVDPSVIHVAGRSGVYRSDDAGASWRPTVNGLGVTAHDDVAIVPDDPNSLYVAITDYRLAWSDDGLETVRGDRPRGAETMATDVEVDATTDPPTVYLAIGDRDENTGGEIYTTTDPSDWDNGWSATGLAAATGGRRPLGMVQGRDNGDVVLLAAVEGSGTWRRQGDGPWELVDGSALAAVQEAANARFAWPEGDAVYLFDRASGVRRSLDRGRTWEPLFAVESNTLSVIMTGYLAAVDTSTVFVSAGDSLYRLDGADAASVDDVVTTLLDGPRHPGALAVGPDGSVWVADRAGPQTDDATPRLLVSADLGATWTDVADDHYRARALNPAALAVGENARIVVATAQSGVMIADGGRAVP